MIEHTYGDAVVTKEATELEEGLKTQTCTICGDVIEEDIPVLSTNVETASDTTEDNVSKNSTDDGNSMLWIIIAVGAIVVIAGVATAVVIKKKKA